MSAVEIAVKKVKKLSAREARELLDWLKAQQTPAVGLKGRGRPKRQKTARQRMKELKAWEDSVRRTTGWEPPRMPNDLVKPFRFA
jgi:hypothetical protein